MLAWIIVVHFRHVFVPKGNDSGSTIKVFNTFFICFLHGFFFNFEMLIFKLLGHKCSNKAIGDELIKRAKIGVSKLKCSFFDIEWTWYRNNTFNFMTLIISFWLFLNAIPTCLTYVSEDMVTTKTKTWEVNIICLKPFACIFNHFIKVFVLSHIHHSAFFFSFRSVMVHFNYIDTICGTSPA